jgi:hypothetical protein
MLTFEVTAIDLILVMAVIILIVLYWTKLSKLPDKPIFQGLTKRTASPKKNTKPQNEYTECPRGLGPIKGINYDGSVSEWCLGCYRIMECYSEGDEIKSNLTLTDEIS